MEAPPVGEPFVCDCGEVHRNPSPLGWCKCVPSHDPKPFSGMDRSNCMVHGVVEKLTRHAIKSNVIGGAEGESFWFWCNGCSSNHRYVTKWPEGETGPTWTFDGDMESPTFSPSLLYNKGLTPEHKAAGAHLCHLFLQAGMVRYLGDCTHDLAGKTVPVEGSP